MTTIKNILIVTMTMISDRSAHSFHVHFLHDSIMQIYKGARIF